MRFDLSLAPIVTADPIIQLHLGFAAVALAFGPLALFRRRRDRLHKIAGYIGSVAMVGLALTALGIKTTIPGFGWFGPIHLLSGLALWGIGQGIYFIRIGDRVRHQRAMQSVWFGALGVAGLFTLLPGRVLNRTLFGGPSEWGYAIVALGGVGLWWLWRGQVATRP